MDQSRKKSFAGGLLSRATTDASFPSLARRFSSTSSPSPLESPSDSSNDKGPLGLTTLYEPLESAQLIVDLVFIHGLGGGSRKTWSLSPDNAHYWPEAWLPDDEDFSGSVRIHTFGYKADWDWTAPRNSPLNIQDFGQSLLGELRNNTAIRRTRTRIILVGHSMGGCVAKKAYILARQDQSARDFAERFHSIIFLATPHRGSDMASLLQTLLSATLSKKPFVHDLEPNSATLSEINSTFRHYAKDLRLWSFYETVGMRNGLVVDKNSATMGYDHEEIAALNADHRHVCKFETPSDSNYKTVRNALVTAIDMVKANMSTHPGFVMQPDPPVQHPVVSLTSPAPFRSSSEELACLRTFLGPRDSLEGDLEILNTLKQPGSCHWFTDQVSFTSWRQGSAPPILWLTGRPAAGKSVLSAHVIEQLKHSLDTPFCSYFIFKHSRGSDANLSECFRTLAFQMAAQDPRVREPLLQLAQDHRLVWDNLAEADVWRQLFGSRIFNLPPNVLERHCWVLDGVDECTRFRTLFDKRLLTTLPRPLRLFATSRPLDEIERGIAALGSDRVSTRVLSKADTLDDIHLLVNTRLLELGRPEDRGNRETMCERILHKSSGSFLWARLVLQEFETTWSEEAMERMLDEIPPGLFELYARMAKLLEVDQRKMLLAKPLLTWIALASRPLTVEELRCAIRLDVQQTLQNVARAVPDLCGQLAFVDQDGRAHLIHETTSEFLTVAGRDHGLQLFVPKKEGHSKLASTLLRYLPIILRKPARQKSIGHADAWRPKTFSKAVATTDSGATDSSLLDYACKFFSDHLVRATSADDVVMEHLSVFLKTSCVLSWVEEIAKGGDLTYLIVAAINMREYCHRRRKYVPPTDKSLQLVEGWATDLIRVAAKFRTQLLSCPWSIHSLIPPLCPSDSTISQLFVAKPSGSLFSSASGLVVKGTLPSSWDDCLLGLDFQPGQATAVAYGDRFFAVGLSSGKISLYDPSSLQELRQFRHPTGVKILRFSPNLDDAYLASCGPGHVAVWEARTGEMLHKLELQSLPLALAFLGRDALLCATQSGDIVKWDLVTADVDSVSWHDLDCPPTPGWDVIPTQTPSRAAFLVQDDHVLLAVGYRSHPVLVLDVLELRLLGACQTGVENNGIDDMTFNPNPETPLLVVSAQSGSLFVFDYTTMELRHTRLRVFADSLAHSLDGRTLVAGKSQGSLEVFKVDFAHHCESATLVSIYQTSHPLDAGIRDVSFSPDGRRIVDVYGHHFRVWAPDALIRNIDQEFNSSAGSDPAMFQLLVLSSNTTGMIETLDEAEITSPLVPWPNKDYLLAGKSNGDVVLFSIADASEISVLYRHARGCAIVSVDVNPSRGLIASADDSARVLVVQFASPPPLLGSEKPVKRLDQRFGGVVQQVLLSPTTDHLLVGGRFEEQVWPIPSVSTPPRRPGQGTSTTLSAKPSSSDASTPSRLVLQHPTNPAWYIVMIGDTARVGSWAGSAQPNDTVTVHLERNQPQPADQDSNPQSHSPASVSSYHPGPDFILEHRRHGSAPSSSRLYMWPASAFHPSLASPETVLPVEGPTTLAILGPLVFKVLGIIAPSTLVFLDMDLWICSMDLPFIASSPSTEPRFQPKGPIAPPAFARADTIPRALSRTSTVASSRRPSVPAQARRHFFALHEWRTLGGERCGVVVPSSSSQTTLPARGNSSWTREAVAFSNKGGIVVVEGGFAFSENVAL